MDKGFWGHAGKEDLVAEPKNIRIFAWICYESRGSGIGFFVGGVRCVDLGESWDLSVVCSLGEGVHDRGSRTPSGFLVH